MFTSKMKIIVYLLDFFITKKLILYFDYIVLRIESSFIKIQKDINNIVYIFSYEKTINLSISIIVNFIT